MADYARVPATFEVCTLSSSRLVRLALLDVRCGHDAWLELVGHATNKPAS
jgi:hypothetical protein